jgi:hypothetical protein
MNTLPFLANVADAVGAPATRWDVPGIIFLKLLAVVFLVLLNGFFVASEFAIVKVRASHLDALAAPSNGRARLARHVASHLDSYLSATQLGVTLASLGLGWLGEPFLADMIEPFFALANITSPVLIETVSFALAFGTITILLSHGLRENWAVTSYLGEAWYHLDIQVATGGRKNSFGERLKRCQP